VPGSTGAAELPRPPALGSGRRFEQASDDMVGTEIVEVRVVSSDRPIVGVQLDGPLQELRGIFQVPPMSFDNGPQIEHLLVLGFMVAGALEVPVGLVETPGIDGQRRREDQLFQRLWNRPVRGLLTLADVQIEPDSLMQLLLVGIGHENGLQNIGRLTIIMRLEGENAALVMRYGLQVGSAGRRFLAFDLIEVPSRGRGPRGT
jgi:hypothetical protein